jgi:hypothetical protein
MQRKIMLDVFSVLLTLACFALVAVIARLVEKR